MKQVRVRQGHGRGHAVRNSHIIKEKAVDTGDASTIQSPRSVLALTPANEWMICDSSKAGISCLHVANKPETICALLSPRLGWCSAIFRSPSIAVGPRHALP